MARAAAARPPPAAAHTARLGGQQQHVHLLARRRRPNGLSLALCLPGFCHSCLLHARPSPVASERASCSLERPCRPATRRVGQPGRPTPQAVSARGPVARLKRPSRRPAPLLLDAHPLPPAAPFPRPLLSLSLPSPPRPALFEPDLGLGLARSPLRRTVRPRPRSYDLARPPWRQLVLPILRPPLLQSSRPHLSPARNPPSPVLSLLDRRGRHPRRPPNGAPTDDLARAGPAAHPRLRPGHALARPPALIPPRRALILCRPAARADGQRRAGRARRCRRRCRWRGRAQAQGQEQGASVRGA